MTVAWKLPEADPVQNSDDAPDPPLMADGLTLHRRSVEFVVTVREIAPLNLFRGPIVIVDEALVPVVTEIFAGLAVSSKS